MRVASLASVGLVAAALAATASAQDGPSTGERKGTEGACGSDMVRVRGFCIDRWEASMVDATSDRPLSPFYPPEPRLFEEIRSAWDRLRHETGDSAARAMPLPEPPAWQLAGQFSPKAVSRPGVVPQGYVSMHVAAKACEAAGKRLCTRDEWVSACRGERDAKFPYGSAFERSKCNVYRYYHPAFVLHGNSSTGHRDPRLNLLIERDVDPVLRLTGATPTCASAWRSDAAYDMVGNLDEWVDDPRGVFVGGFYARATTSGCEARVSSHSPAYFDYSTGTRCCRDARTSRVAAGAQGEH